VYGFVERQNLPAFFRTFDFANPNEHVPQRPETVAPQQALFFMNSPFVIEQAAALAERSGSGSGAQSAATGEDGGTASRVTRLFQYALGRGPTAEETSDALAFLQSGDASSSQSELQWERLAQVLLMSNEFAFID
jgi:hypothetical protein